MGYIELNVLDNAVKTVILGIDLGTTNSLAAVWDQNGPRVLAPEGESPIVPSIIYVPREGKAIVGNAAKAQAVVDPTHTLFSIKRFMGRGIGDIQADLSLLPYTVSETDRQLVQFEVRGKKITPQQASALILQEVGRRAAQALGGADIVQAVITVPAYFDEPQRQATRDAAKLAGIEVLRIVSEPTAACLAYGLDQKGEGNIVVYDLGGGTFDVSVLRVEDGVFQVLATAGDTALGGDDFDRTLLRRFQGELRAAGTADESLADPTFLAAARLAAEQAKKELSSAPAARVQITLPELGIDYRATLERGDFEALIQPLVQRTLDACSQALRDAGLSAAEIDEVVLVGGSTRVPLVRGEVERVFQRKPHTELNPDHVVALGAAAQAQVLTGGRRDVLLLDVTPLSLGLETMGGAVSKMIERNSTIPCSHTEGFTTYVDGQTGLDLNIVQGERELASDCRSLGRFQLTGIPPMPAGMPKIAVRFHLDADGVLTVTAREESTGTSTDITVQPMHGLTDAEVEAMLRAGFENAQADFDHRRVVELLTEMGTMLRAIDKNLEAAQSHLDPETLTDLFEATTAARAAVAAGPGSADKTEVQALRDRLEQASLPLAAVLMDSVVKQTVSGKNLSDL
ncbi:MAG: Fe-S protein assembly chaperone HscA [Planctomycetota bacterium]